MLRSYLENIQYDCPSINLSCDDNGMIYWYRASKILNLKDQKHIQLAMHLNHQLRFIGS